MKKSDNKICFVILNYNSFDDTKDCLISLLNQTVQSFDILIIDNDSSDNSLKGLQTDFPDLIFIKNEKNLGFSGGCNIGIKFCVDNGYDYVFLLNNDTIAHPKLTENIYSYIKLNQNVSILTGKIFYKDFPNKLWYSGGKIDYLRLKGIHFQLNKKLDNDYEVTNAEADKVSFISGCMMLIKSDVFSTIGLLDDFFFANYEDVDFCIRANSVGLTMSYLSDAIIWHKVSPNFRSKSKLVRFTPFLYYLKARNKTYLIKKYAKFYSIIYLILFNTPKLFKYILGFAVLLKFKEFKYLFLGFYDGLYGKPIRFTE